MKSAYFFVSAFTVLTFLRPQEFLSWIKFPLLSILMALALAGYLGVKDKNLSTPIHKYIFSFFIVVVISCTLNNPSLAFDRIWKFLLNIILPTVLLSNVLTSIDRQKRLMFWLVLTGGFIAHHSIGQYYSPDHLGWTGLEAMWRTDKKLWQVLWYGIMADPNDLGQFFLVLVPFTIYLFGQATSILIKLILLTNFGLIMVGIFLTNSRGTLLGLLIVTGYWFFRKYGVFKTAVAVLVASPGILIIASSGGEISAEDESANQRLDAWIQGYFMFRDNILFGVGALGGFAENHNKTAHNTLVLTYAETGILGYFMWTFMLFATWLWLYKLSAGQSFSDANLNLNKKIEKERVLADTLLYSLLGFLISAFFLSRSYTMILFMLVGYTMAQIVRFEKLIPGYKFEFKWYLFAPITVASVVIITVVSFKMR